MQGRAEHNMTQLAVTLVTNPNVRVVVWRYHPNCAVAHPATTTYNICGLSFCGERCRGSGGRPNGGPWIVSQPPARPRAFGASPPSLIGNRGPRDLKGEAQIKSSPGISNLVTEPL